jgi:hypothetical protein
MRRHMWVAAAVALLLAIGLAAPAGAAEAAWAKVFTWSGGGPGNDIRNSSPFVLEGGRQLFKASTVAVPGEYSWPSSGWTVESADGGHGFEMLDFPDMGRHESHLYMEAGSYFVHSNTLDCTWTIEVWELRPTVTLELRGLKAGTLKLGKRVAVAGLVTPNELAGTKVKLIAQMRKHGDWRAAASGYAKVGSWGTYSATFKPVKVGAYRLCATLQPTFMGEAATTKWYGVRVRAR